MVVDCSLDVGWIVDLSCGLLYLEWWHVIFYNSHKQHEQRRRQQNTTTTSYSCYSCCQYRYCCGNSSCCYCCCCRQKDKSSWFSSNVYRKRQREIRIDSCTTEQVSVRCKEFIQCDLQSLLRVFCFLVLLYGRQSVTVSMTVLH